MNFFATESDIALCPATDPDVIACQAALEAATEQVDAAQQAWRQFIADRGGDLQLVPMSLERLRLHDSVRQAEQAAAAAESVWAAALEAAKAKATAAWNDKIRQQFREDLPMIETFIAMLAAHEATVVEAQAAGVRHALKVPEVFLTGEEVRARLAYAKGQMGLTT